MVKYTSKKSIYKKIICVLLCGVLISSSLFGTAQATGNGVVGTYSYSTHKGGNNQATDVFEYHDECFERPSSLGCGHLITLSAQAAMASRSRFGENEDTYEQDPSHASENIKAMLGNMGFADVESNSWYSHEMLENSVGVALGHRTINVNGKEYTLLAIIPRSAGYRQEWAGNMNVGEYGIHEGFKEARDEILRFTKKYIGDHNINGNLKVWIAGHSRGGAVSNILGGFFASGGIAYFGDSVSITPEDVYCYTFGTPRTIIPGASNNEILSVSGNRSGIYTYDTPGEAYNYTGGGIVWPLDDIYKGIRNYPFSYDFITYVPLEMWGFNYYGNVYSYDGVTNEMMEEKLKELDENVYRDYMDKGAASGFSEKIFNIANLEIEDVPGGLSGEIGMTYYVQDRLNQGLEHFNTVEKYIGGGYQDALGAYMSSFSMLQPFFGQIEGIQSLVVQPALFGYLDFASKKLVTEGRAGTEKEGAAIALLEIIEFAIDDERDIDSYNVDSFVVDLATFVKNNKDKKAVDQIKEILSKAIPPQYVTIAKPLLGNFYPDPNVDINTLSMGDVIIEYIVACVDGAAGSKQAQSDPSFNDPKKVREYFYQILGALSLFSEDIDKIKNVVNGGNGLFKDASWAILEVMMKYKNPDTGGTEIYANLADASDGEFIDAINVIQTRTNTIIENNGLYNQDFKNMLNAHLEEAKSHVSQMREVVMDVLFDSDYAFDTLYNICNVATIIGNIDKIPFAHYTELCVSYGKAGNNLNKEDVVVLEPIARKLFYNGNEQELILKGYITNSDVYYALSDSKYTPPEDSQFSLDIPKGTNAGTYYVWYKGVGDVHHKDTSPSCIEVTIAESGGLVPNAYGNKVANVPKTNDILRSFV